ncbi:acyl-CoA hydrolase [Pseudoxanthomonas sp. 3HH-4]|nr:acyl-CoA hydrolase [Pseudoxanthomonas sp. 3HH-4]
MMTSRPRGLTLQFLAEPTDVNYGGKVHGGAVMKWIDQAGFAAAVGWSGSYCVTVAVGGIRFVAPVKISNLVAVSATLVRTGRTSMQFVVEVRARSPLGGEDTLCTHCIIVFVAVDRETGASVEVPQWQPQTDEDRQFFEYAEKVMILSRSIEDTVARYTAKAP